MVFSLTQLLLIDFSHLVFRRTVSYYFGSSAKKSKCIYIDIYVREGNWTAMLLSVAHGTERAKEGCDQREGCHMS